MLKVALDVLFYASMKLSATMRALAHRLLNKADFETDNLSISMYIANGRALYDL
jgi:hypothetical protein